MKLWQGGFIFVVFKNSWFVNHILEIAYLFSCFSGISEPAEEVFLLKNQSQALANLLLPFCLFSPNFPKWEPLGISCFIFDEGKQHAQSDEEKICNSQSLSLFTLPSHFTDW